MRTALGFFGVALSFAFSLGLGACTAQGMGFSDANGEGGAGDPSTDGGGGDAKIGEGGGPGSDAHVGPGGSDGGPSKCGSQVCVGGATCVASACVYGCVGSNVPGDYATVQAAATALAPTGGTICLAAQSYVESVSVSSTMPISIIGISSDKSILQGLYLGGTNTTVKGVGVTNYASVSSGTVVLAGVDFKGVSSPALSIDCASTAGCSVAVTGSKFSSPASNALHMRHTYPLTFTMGESEVAGGTSYYGIDIQEAGYSPANPLNITVQNSYIHGASKGFYYWGSSSYSTPTMKLDNNTFMTNTTGLQTAQSYPMTLSYYNNIFSENTTGVDLIAGSTVTHGNNGLFGNVSNYASTAVDGAGYVKADLMLDKSTTPPSLKPGSPCVGSGDRTNAPSFDYWGNSRATSVDIGAVQ